MTMKNDYSREFGTALYALAVEEGVSERVFGEFGDIKAVFADNPGFVRLLSNPRLSAAERAETVGKVFDGKIDGSLLNALKLLAEKRRCDCVPKCYEVYKRLYCDDHNIVPVTAVSAVKLSEAQRARLVEKLEKSTGSKILPDERTDSSIIGGMRLEYGGKRYDASVSGRLRALERQIKNSD